MLKLTRKHHQLMYRGRVVMYKYNLDFWDFPEDAKTFWISASLKPGGVPVDVYMLPGVVYHRGVSLPIPLANEIFNLGVPTYTRTLVYLELWYEN
jgi:hypothetical protein